MTEVVRIVKTWTIVGARDEQEALLEVQDIEPESTTVRTLDVTDDRYGRVGYEQPIEVLDLAWDDYMDRSLPPNIKENLPRLPLPSLADLGTTFTISPPMLSALFDCAISAYRRHAETKARLEA